MSNMSKFKWLAILLLFAVPGFADQPATLQLGAYAYHFDRSDDWCEDNPMVGFTGESGYSIIVVRNSLCNWTAFPNKRWQLNYGFAIRAGAFWSEDDYLFGWNAGPIATLEWQPIRGIVISILGEAAAIHWEYEI